MTSRHGQGLYAPGPIGILTIGQAPRPDLLAELTRAVPAGTVVLLRGALDGLSRPEVISLRPTGPDDTLFTILPDGTGVSVSHAAVAVLARKQLERLRHDGCAVVAFCCTGEFPELSDLSVVFPARVHVSVAQAVAPGCRLGVFVPLAEQTSIATERWQAAGFAGVTAVALAPNAPSSLVDAAAVAMLHHEPDLVVYDCMSYGTQLRVRADAVLRRPAILSISLVARVVAELAGATQED